MYVFSIQYIFTFTCAYKYSMYICTYMYKVFLSVSPPPQKMRSSA